MNRIVAALGRVVPVGVESLDAAAVPALEPALAAAAAADAGPVVLDLRAVRFADSAGLGLLVRLHRRPGGPVAMAGVGDGLRRCLGRVAPDLLPPEVGLPPAVSRQPPRCLPTPRPLRAASDE